MTKIAISQPTYLPWLGYFQQIAQVDCFVFLDNVQFEKQSWQSRNRIKDHQDNVIWLSVPVARHALDAPIMDIALANQRINWQRKHLNSVKTYLAKTPYLAEVVELIEPVFNTPYDRLADLNIALIRSVCRRLGLETPLLKASELGVSGQKADLLLAILQQLNADSYLANQGSRVYLEQERARFAAQGIQLCYQNWEHPMYHQKGQQFISHLAWLDAICYLGFDAHRLQLIT
ncbi:WbqC family protein [Alkalimonas sp. NCh-2]|uniref:WbqC family protein n=1 Tax=Alkalimonas sp. NCh-2 TaxID=3144846 RepID=UPI0031F68602